MKQKLFPPFYWLCTILLLAFSLQLGYARAADGIEIEQAHLEDSAEGYRLSATFAFDLNRGLEDALTRGIPLYFTTEIEITRPRWYWFDAKEIVGSQTIRISYNVLTRQYHAAITGRLQQSFQTLDDALSLVRRPNRWVVADKDALKAGQSYAVAVRMQLDVAQLPKPFQVHALNSSDWRLSSNWKHFIYTAER
ncbi:DUF4390 domain-containing protein [Herminiimonas fonticola]|uniref:DUF4390 domain-containing protein n=1 Tax=Herminiimonas fonticola TaxID=303380 RepID=UPI003342CA9E